MTKVLRFPCYFARITNLKFFTYLHFCFLENILGNLSFIQHHVCSQLISQKIITNLTNKCCIMSQFIAIL
jgi:hypothetical protein